MRRRVLALAAVAVLTPAAAAEAAPSVVHTSAFRFVPETVVVDRGGTLTHTNADIAPHNVVAVQKDADGRPLFSSGEPKPIGAWPVEGVDRLVPGSYGFLCTIHPYMKGKLEVRPEDLPEPPPGGAALPVATVPAPTSLAVLRDHLYVAGYADGIVRRLPIVEGGLLGAPEIYAQGFQNPLGIAFADDGTMFVSDAHPSGRAGRTNDGRVWAVAPGGTDRAVVIDDLPNGRHATNGLAVRDGRLHIANGNSTDDGASGGDPEEPLSGTLLSVPLDARGLTPARPEVRVEARGMRNLFDVAFRPGTDEAWIPTNGPDMLDPWGEDLLHKADVDATGDPGQPPPPDFGFPACVYAAPPAEPRVKQNPSVAATHVCGEHAPPEQLLGLHASPNGLAFGPQDAFWGGDLFIAEFGNFFGLRPAGHQVVRVPVDDAGRAGEPRTFLPGVAPLDLTFGPHGMYVADFVTGQITLVRGT